MQQKGNQQTPPVSYVNWRMSQGEHPIDNVIEARLYTDALVTGDRIDLGPYTFIETFAYPSYHPSSLDRARLVLRVRYYIRTYVLSQHRLKEGSDFDHYHGGDLFDEVAALCSLFMGARMMAGNKSRQFTGDDPYGRPFEWELKPEPRLPPVPRHPLIPSSTERQELSLLTGLSKLPMLSVADANAAVKAARLYQQAVWLADVDANTAWLLLVSAIETAAERWSESTASPQEDHSDFLPRHMKDIMNLVQQECSKPTIDKISAILLRYTGSTRKFVSFLLHFVPSPPDKRPYPYARLCFEPTDLKTALTKIYDYRSKALHGGMSFPYPMCESPSRDRPVDESGQIYPEVPIALATSALGARWDAKDTPMLFHTFEYIARGALLNWWWSLPTEAASDG